MFAFLPLAWLWVKNKIAANGQLLVAVVAVVLVAVAMLGVVTAVRGIANGIRSSEQLRLLRERIAVRNEVDTKLKAANKKAEEAAERERLAAESAEQSRARVSELEAALKALQDKSGDPVVWPADLVKELRK